jgi:hypothetical protein
MIIAVLIYAFFTVVTFGHLYRTSSVLHTARNVALSLGWPAYWIVSRGVGQSLRVFFACIGIEGEHITWLSFSAGIFTAGFFTARNWGTCTDALSCSLLTVKAAALLPGFPFYWGWILAS